MKWNKAIGIIESAMNKGLEVEITFHRKWMKHETEIMDVDHVVDYDYCGETCKAVYVKNPPIYNMIDDGGFIIDEVNIKSGETNMTNTEWNEGVNYLLNADEGEFVEHNGRIAEKRGEYFRCYTDGAFAETVNTVDTVIEAMSYLANGTFIRR